MLILSQTNNAYDNNNYNTKFKSHFHIILLYQLFSYSDHVAKHCNKND